MESLLPSIRMINGVAYYRVEHYERDDRLLVSDVRRGKAGAASLSTTYYSDTAAGTGTLVLARGDRIAFLTSAHVVVFPDTVWSFHPANPTDSTRYVQAVAVKERTTMYVPDIPGADELEILAADPDADLAVVGQRLADLSDRELQEFGVPTGNEADLDWGSFVYILGYPAGVKMLTRGIVSRSFRRGHQAFVVDATFNPGVSGAPVLAIRDGIPNFEWIGIATASAASTEYVLSPDIEDRPADSDLPVEYEGTVYLTRKRTLRYGITTCASADAIRVFFSKEKSRLSALGYRIELP